jgi:tRNA(Ile)-lysidine synthase
LTALQQQVRRTIRRHALCPPGSRVLVGLSGGSDSVALTYLLRELAEHGDFEVAALAHLNHQLRPTAARDEAFCRELASRLGLGIVVESADVQSYARQERRSIEDAARVLRYEFLERAAGQSGADQIAVGHTQDDQAETFLMKLMRGAGLTGLAGIYPRRGRIIRPLLDVTRAELRSYLDGKGERWVDDETNEDLDNPRNRVRHRVIPELDRAAGGATRPNIARAAAAIREDGQWLDQQAAEWAGRLVVPTEAGLELDAQALADAPPPVRRRVVLEAMRRAAASARAPGRPEREIGQEHVETVMAVLAGGQGPVDVPGSRVELRRGKLVLIQQKPVVR